MKNKRVKKGELQSGGKRKRNKWYTKFSLADWPHPFEQVEERKNNRMAAGWRKRTRHLLARAKPSRRHSRAAQQTRTNKGN